MELSKIFNDNSDSLINSNKALADWYKKNKEEIANYINNPNEYESLKVYGEHPVIEIMIGAVVSAEKYRGSRHRRIPLEARAQTAAVAIEFIYQKNKEQLTPKQKELYSINLEDMLPKESCSINLDDTLQTESEPVIDKEGQKRR